MSQTFFDIDIVKYLRENNSPFYCKIKELFNLSKMLLNEIPKTFSNYTLHDIDHSIRVLEYMNEFVKNNLNAYSELHLAIMVYVALLHDTGMVVSDDEEIKLYGEFEKKNPDFLNLSTTNKKEYLKDFIRENHAKRVRNVLDFPINTNTSIRSLCYVGETQSYDLSEQIALICQSHTENYEWLIRNLDSDFQIAQFEINPQHIAILLRLADVLDIDDRRAPWLLYKFLNPNGKSDDEWRKHIPIRNYKKVFFENNEYHLRFFGECSDPKIYKKVLEYIEWINEEAKKLNSTLNKFVGVYKFKVAIPIETNIKAIGFIATPLRFNLKYEQISNLLMGEKIYGSKQDGLRELIQNAIDTVLSINDIINKNAHSSYTPTIGIEINKKSNQFIVFDNGAGMSEEILNEYFFNIGNSYYISDEYKNEMHEYKPIGHFGIGFLACFMLSSKIKLETKHYKSSKTIKMDFEKDSPYVTMYDSNNDYSFSHGTRIIMPYNDIFPHVFKDAQELISYIKKLIITDGYQFVLICDGRKENISINKPSKRYITKEGIIEFDYKLASYPNIKFDLIKFFENNEFVYIVMDDMPSFYDSNFVRVEYFKESIFELDRILQKHNENIPQSIEDMIYETGAFADIFEEILLRNYDDIIKYYLRNHSVYGYFSEYLNIYLKGNCLEWFDIPIIDHNSTFNAFLNRVEVIGESKALYEYRNDIKFISVLCNTKPTDKLILDIIEHYLMHTSSEVVLDYCESYPITPIKMNQQIIKANNFQSYSIINDNYCLDDNSKYNMYLKGIRILDKSIVLPHIISDTQLEYLFINIDSNGYDTDVSRNNFDANTKEKLTRYITHIIYEDIINNSDLSADEKDLIKTFLNTFY